MLADLGAVRRLAARINERRAGLSTPLPPLSLGDLNAMGLIDEALHLVVAAYQRERDPRSMVNALESAERSMGRAALDQALLAFVDAFPGSEVPRGALSPAAWLAGETGGIPHRAVALEESLLLWLANRNPAFKPFAELFDDHELAQRDTYLAAIESLGRWFATRPRFGPFDQALVDMLRSPAIEFPDSLAGQLDYIRRHWGHLLGDFALRLLTALDVLGEEEHARWLRISPGIGERPADSGDGAILRFERGEHEPERFSPDRDWMPRVVLIAKSVHVWLDQLAKQYSREVRRLDQIPDEELDRLARWGVNGIWLIGVWERSRASQRIKQLCGNPDAAASAYSLLDYRVADELGGGPALERLKERAWARGIRMASDMVPNHMGIDSRWVIEHPDWFLSVPEPPFPAYSYGGPDVSADERVAIQIDDHYYDKTDAAVVFKRTDRASGDTRFIYHGNDGTSYPWNDTAQLNYLRPEVREGLIQTILHVARQFPIIRFDAAMTLAKRHYQRLWFPEPGSGGAIPSRAEHGLTRAAFDAAMPQEFWREVVDRAAVEAPDTLLLAEAFWLMEGYFVRTLGMHRVYNSAFMVMMRDEDNAKYRSVIKNTLEFDPDIMKRYVNFMSNPDERTAIDQFGKGDKCFGVAALMSTLPGLPMFGHGQIEGFTEKYGMEYQRPRYDEWPDRWLVERHEREIAPLLDRRWLFAESYNFLLYDFFHDSGSVDENVFAYSNRVSIERALIIYNNRYGETHGTVRISATYADKGSGQLRQRSLWEGLELQDPSSILTFRDSLTGLEYLRRAGDVAERGLTVHLHAYQCHVFLDWRELHASAEKAWDRLCDQLGGRGVPSVEDALVNLELRPVHDAVRAVLDPTIVRMLAGLAEVPRVPGATQEKTNGKKQNELFDHAWARCEHLVAVVHAAYARAKGEKRGAPATPPDALAPVFRKWLRSAARIPALEALFPSPWTSAARRTIPNSSPQLPVTALWGPVLGWCLLQVLVDGIDAPNREQAALDMFDRLRLREPFAQAFTSLGFEAEDGWRAASRIKALLLIEAECSNQVREPESAPASPATVQPDVTTAAAEALVAEATSAVPERAPVAPTPIASPAKEKQTCLPISVQLWQDPDIRWLAGVHEAEGKTYLVRESIEELLWWLNLPKMFVLGSSPLPSRAVARKLSEAVGNNLADVETAGYRLDVLLGHDETIVEQPKAEPSPAEPKPEAPEPKSTKRVELVPEEPISDLPVVPVNPDGPPENY